MFKPPLVGAAGEEAKAAPTEAPAEEVVAFVSPDDADVVDPPTDTAAAAAT